MISFLWLIPFFGAFLLLLCRQVGFGSAQKLALGVTGANLLYLILLTTGWNPDQIPQESLNWIPEVGLKLDFWLDGPALFYSWLVSAIGFLVVQYAGHYMKPDDAPWRFYTSILLFLAAMQGMVISRDFLLMFVFWEVTSLTSFLLIGHWHEDPEARKGARRALLITGMGGLSLMAGLAMLGIMMQQITGSFNLHIDTFWEHRNQINVHPLVTPTLIFILIGALTKSAQFPFHFWLPGAMKAPTPVSALLHAATMVKAGIYLLGRLYPVFSDQFLWLFILGGAGTLSMLVGGYLAITSTDIKKLLAYSTVSQLGLLTSYYGFGYQRIGGEELLKLDLLLVASHALFKAGLFMICGIIDHGTHTRDWTQLGGLRKKMPWTTVLTVAGCISMGGLPFSLGFIAKKLFLEAGLKLQSYSLAIEDVYIAAALVASVLTVGYCFVLAVKPFFGKPRDEKIYESAHEGSAGFLFAPALLISLCIIGGIYVPVLEKPLSAVTNTEYFASKTYFNVGWFKKADFLFWISMAMYFVFGPLILIFQRQIQGMYQWLGSPAPVMKLSDLAFDDWLARVASILGRAAKPGTHQYTLSIVMICLVGVAVANLQPLSFTGIDFFFEGPSLVAHTSLLILIAVGALGMVLFSAAYARILSLGLVGLSVAGVFVIYRAPDLAMTQLLVELVVLLMFLGLVKRIDRFRHKEVEESGRKAFRFALSVLSGLVVAAVTYTAASSDPATLWSDRLSPANYYLSNAYYPEVAEEHSGGGNNVVNVTLVDFRAFDTFGEVAVLVIAALGVFVLISGSIYSKKTAMEKKVSAGKNQKLFAIEVSGRMISIICAIYAFVLFLVGHQMPGGGFIAGLLAAVIFIPHMLRAKSLKVPAIPSLLGAGLVIIVITGLWPVLAGEPFLKSAFGTHHLPLLGELKLSSAIAFDSGVFIVVFAVTLALMQHFAFASVKGEKGKVL